MDLYTPFFLAALVLSGLVSAFTLHLGVSIFLSILGKENAISDHAVNGLFVWPVSIVISVALCVSFEESMAWSALLFVPVGPILTIIGTSLVLRNVGRAAREQGFYVEKNRTVKTSDQTVIVPEYLTETSDYTATGAASGYTIYTIRLKRDFKVQATNTYTTKEERDELLQSLIQDLSIPCFSVCFMEQVGRRRFRTVHLGGEWGELIIARDSRMPSAELPWWQLLFQPTFRQDDVIKVRPFELAERVNIVAQAWPDRFHRSPVLPRQLQAMRALTAGAKDWIQVRPDDSMSDYLERKRGKDFLQLEFVDEVAVQEIISLREL